MSPDERFDYTIAFENIGEYICQLKRALEESYSREGSLQAENANLKQQAADTEQALRELNGKYMAVLSHNRTLQDDLNSLPGCVRYFYGI